jgi:hypothetical protein
MPRRPVSVTIVVVLTWVIGLVTIGDGVWLMFGPDSRLESLGINTDRSVTTGLIYIVTGLLVVVFASALGGGSRLARVFISLLMVFRFVLGGIAVGVLWSQSFAYMLTASIVPLVSLLILYLLWNARASAWFASR